jgi:hypothetical protein
VIVSVVSGERTIFCEGKQSSLDFKLLSRVVEGISGDQCTIIPAGSKFTFSIFAEGYFFPNEVTNQRYIFFRDRDFDVEPSFSIKLLKLSNKSGDRHITLTHRSCVENYLLDAKSIDTYWTTKYEEKIDNPTSKWGHGKSPGIEAITQWIELSARNLQYYQAVRWALGYLASKVRKQFKTTWTKGSGTLPELLDLPSCQSQALELINQYRQKVDSVTPENFETKLNSYQEIFIQSDFWTQEQYLIWFHGKDLQKEMQKQQPKYISLSSFFDWAFTELNIENYPDLKKLKENIEQL